MQAKIVQTPEAQRAAGSSRAHGWDTRPIWQSAVVAWVGQRLLLGALVALWQALVGGFSWYAFYLTWTTWDASWYNLIARYGYRILPQAAYFPLYPFLIHLVAAPLGGRVALAGVLIANGCSLAAFVVLGMLVEREFNAKTARRTLFYYALFPTGLFFIGGFTEGLFLLLSVATFLCLRQRRWLLAGALITLATLTRAQGALLLAPLLVEAWRALRPEWMSFPRARKLRSGLALASAVALPLGAFLAFQGYLAAIYRVPNVLSRAAASPAWRRYPDWPWAGIVNDVTALMSGGKSPPTLEVMKDFVFLAFWMGLCALMLFRFWRGTWPALPLSWIVYSWASLFEMLILPAHTLGHGVMSAPRYVLAVFPCFALMALLGERYPRAHRLMVALCIAWLIILTRMWVGELFIA